MGTNYYHHEKEPCPTCGHEGDEPRHIGKSSGGWCFSLHVYPEEGIADLGDWKARWGSGVIKDEYGKTVTPDDMESRITQRSWEPAKRVPMGYADWSQFHEQNGSEPGPSGLLRHRIGPHCLGHGAGTWDLIAGDFS
jgi:hypothetical protein